MSEGIQIYAYNNETIFQINFFNITKLNFMDYICHAMRLQILHSWIYMWNSA